MTWDAAPVFFLGSVSVIVSMFWLFHQPEGVNEIRYATPRDRYKVAVGGYLLLGIFCFTAIWSASIFIVSSVGNTGVEDLNNLSKVDIGFVAWLTFLVACVISLFSPAIGPVARLVSRSARAAQAFAGYPTARSRLIAAMGTASFVPHLDACNILTKELDRYGIADESIKIISGSAFRSLIQVVSLNLCFASLGEKRVNQSFFHKYRRDQWERWQQQYRRLLRRTARALLGAESIFGDARASDDSLEHMRLAISNFVIEESEDVLGRGRLLLAELALSTLTWQATRENLLRTVGYNDISLSRPIPIAPVLIVLCLEFITFLLPPLLAVVGVSIFPRPLPWDRALIFASARAICQALAIILAIYPKSVSSFARPSLLSLPWQSYILFGVASFFGGASIFFVMFYTLPSPGPMPPLFGQLVLALANGVFFVITTVTVSILIDKRLQRRDFELSSTRFSDAAICGLAGAASMLVFAAIVWLVTPFLQAPPPPPNFFIFVLKFAALLGSEGLIIGYFIPVLAASHLLTATAEKDESAVSPPPVASCRPSPALVQFTPGSEDST